MVTLCGCTVRVKSGAAVTVMVIDAKRCPLTPAAVPTNVPVNVVNGAVVRAVTVTTCEPPAGMLNACGLNVKSELVGDVTLTIPVNPLRPVAETVTVVLCPAGRENTAGFTDREKSGPGLI